MAAAFCGGRPITALLVDSDYRTRATDSQSSFRFEIPEQITCSPGCMAVAHSISVGHSAFVIRTGENGTLFYRERTNAQGDYQDRSIQLDQGNATASTLATQLGTKLTANTAVGGATYSATFDALLNRITITAANGHGFKIFSTHELRAGDWFGEPILNPSSCNEILAVPYSQAQAMDAAGFTVAWSSGSVNLSIPAFFLRCPQLGGSKLDHLGRRDIIAVVQLDTEQFGDVVTSNAQPAHPELQWIDVSNKELRSLDIQLTDKN